MFSKRSRLPLGKSQCDAKNSNEREGRQHRNMRGIEKIENTSDIEVAQMDSGFESAQSVRIFRLCDCSLDDGSDDRLVRSSRERDFIETVAGKTETGIG